MSTICGDLGCGPLLDPDEEGNRWRHPDFLVLAMLAVRGRSISFASGTASIPATLHNSGLDTLFPSDIRDWPGKSGKNRS